MRLTVQDVKKLMAKIQDATKGLRVLGGRLKMKLFKNRRGKKRVPGFWWNRKF